MHAPSSDVIDAVAIMVIVVAVPGPSVAYTVNRAVFGGRRAALLNVVGNTIGLILQVVTVSFGVGTLIERTPVFSTLITLVGAAALVVFGTQAIRHCSHVAPSPIGPSGRPRSMMAIRNGAFVGATNPKTLAFLVVVLPAFTARDTGSYSLHLLALGLSFPIIALFLDGAWALAAVAARTWIADSPRRLAVLGTVSGTVMVARGIGPLLKVGTV